MKKIECVIFDWAGTTVDYGCFAPVAAFLETFRRIGIEIKAEEARRPMGMTKIDHIRALFTMERIAAAFGARYGRAWTEDDVRARYADFKDSLFASLRDYTDPIPHVPETVAALRAAGLKIGSTTGYTAEMMDVVRPAAAEKGYAPDVCVTSDGLPAGRPQPYMIYRNLCELGVASRRCAVKFGDTIADIREGVNAGVWTVGVVLGSNEMALTEAEAAALAPAEAAERMAEVRRRMYAAGADYVVDDITGLPGLVECINRRIAYED